MKENVVVPYNLCTNLKELSTVGGGVYLYFLYIKFAIFILFVSSCINAIPETYFLKHINNNINTFCNYFSFDNANTSNNTNSTSYSKIIFLTNDTSLNCTFINYTYNDFLSSLYTEKYSKRKFDNLYIFYLYKLLCLQ